MPKRDGVLVTQCRWRMCCLLSSQLLQFTCSVPRSTWNLRCGTSLFFSHTVLMCMNLCCTHTLLMLISLLQAVCTVICSYTNKEEGTDCGAGHVCWSGQC